MPAGRRYLRGGGGAHAASLPAGEEVPAGGPAAFQTRSLPPFRSHPSSGHSEDVVPRYT